MTKEDDNIVKELEGLKDNLKKSQRIIWYLGISVAVWLTFQAYRGFILEQYDFGLTIIGTLAIGFFWLFVQQKVIASTYLTLLQRYLSIIRNESDKRSKEVLDHLSDESTSIIKPEDMGNIPDITELSKAKTDEELK